MKSNDFKEDEYSCFIKSKKCVPTKIPPIAQQNKIFHQVKVKPKIDRRKSIEDYRKELEPIVKEKKGNCQTF